MVVRQKGLETKRARREKKPLKTELLTELHNKTNNFEQPVNLMLEFIKM